jgi:hypothetical protein
VDPDAAAPDQAALDRLNAAFNRAEEARQRALDFDAPVYFPPEWESADEQYQSLAGGTDRSSLGGVKTAVARYEEAAAVFDDLFQKSLPPYAQDREDEILEARSAALDAGAEELLPSYLIQADETALEALSRYEDEDYQPAKDAAILARDLYGVLKTGAEAYGLRLEIEDRDFYRFDPKNVDMADAAGLAASDAYLANNPAEAGDRAAEALLRYNQALTTGRESLAAERRDFAAEERRIALELKANVAVRQDFAAADAIYSQANRSFDAQDYGLSVDLYEEAGFLFIRTQQEALEKRRLAEEAIASAEEKMLESDEIARNAELILEGGEE